MTMPRSIATPAPAPAGPDAFFGAAPAAQALLDLLPVGIYTCDRDGRIESFNRRAAALWGREPKLRDPAELFCGSHQIYRLDGVAVPRAEIPMAEVLRTGIAAADVEAIVERPDGTRIPFIPYPTPLRDAAGKVTGAINMLVDISDRKRAEARQKSLLDELNHRVKNTLATVQSLAAQTMRGDRDRDEQREAFEERLLALSRVHNQLAREQWESADLGRIVHDIVAPFGQERVSVDGASTKLASVAALPLAMVLHELATNAAKFGALSAPEGRLALGWKIERVNGARRLRIDWRESGGPEVQPPVYRGFGSRLLERSVGQELRGSAQLDFDPAGLRCRLEIPLHAADA